MPTVFVNPERCIGCLQCELACAVEHSATQDESLAFLETPIPRKRVHVEAGPVPTFAFPNCCRHCNPAPCLQVCPTGAITRDEEHDLVLVEPARCIGCAMCALVCPFDVVTFHPLAEGPASDVPVAVKCDGCIDRVARGDFPACVEVCKVDALVFGDINDLVAAGRLRETGAVLAAAGATPSEPASGDPLVAWRAWGGAIASAAAGAAERRPFGPPRNGTVTADGTTDRPPTGDHSEEGPR
jgi:carbon-monoxide dehydrogenase iron sulfur subunit